MGSATRKEECSIQLHPRETKNGNHKKKALNEKSAKERESKGRGKRGRNFTGGEGGEKKERATGCGERPALSHPKT